MQFFVTIEATIGISDKVFLSDNNIILGNASTAYIEDKALELLNANLQLSGVDILYACPSVEYVTKTNALTIDYAQIETLVKDAKNVLNEIDQFDRFEMDKPTNYLEPVGILRELVKTIEKVKEG